MADDPHNMAGRCLEAARGIFGPQWDTLSRDHQYQARDQVLNVLLAAGLPAILERLAAAERAVEAFVETTVESLDPSTLTAEQVTVDVKSETLDARISGAILGVLVTPKPDEDHGEVVMRIRDGVLDMIREEAAAHAAA